MSTVLTVAMNKSLVDYMFGSDAEDFELVNGSSLVMRIKDLENEAASLSARISALSE